MKKWLEQFKIYIWRLVYGIYYRCCYKLTSSERHKLQILDSVATLKYIIDNKCSISRYGDGEFQMITHLMNHGTVENFEIDSFQNFDPILANRLWEILKCPIPNHLVCIPYAFKDSSVQRGYQRIFFEREWLLRKKDIIDKLDVGRLWGDSCFTRFYYGRRDIKDYEAYVMLLKKIWNQRKLLIVEGEQSRLGIDNDLFDNTSEICRILCPITNAFAKYEEILSATKRVSKDYLVIIALGHTATVLSYDLSKCGYQAIDIGHVDIEYEWLRMKAKHKVVVPNKYVNEVDNGRVITSLEEPIYQSQIIERI